MNKIITSDISENLLNENIEIYANTLIITTVAKVFTHIKFVIIKCKHLGVMIKMSLI